MYPDRKEEERTSSQAFEPAPTGNASNPEADGRTAGDEGLSETGEGIQLLDPKADKYIREVAGPEDYPDAQDQSDLDEAYRQKDSSQ
ncbi:MAG TPA: hypothetical protein VHK91_08865 [Flavisolibacter sp.]|jgi:hypothetical protein|nr:hypothetical protein [Flavisolibacter sp.]